MYIYMLQTHLVKLQPDCEGDFDSVFASAVTFRHFDHLNGLLRLLTFKSEMVCCSALQCFAVCSSMLQCVAMFCSVLQCVALTYKSDMVCCSVLQCVAAFCIMLQCAAVCCSALL